MRITLLRHDTTYLLIYVYIRVVFKQMESRSLLDEPFWFVSGLAIRSLRTVLTNYEFYKELINWWCVLKHATLLTHLCGGYSVATRLHVIVFLVDVLVRYLYKHALTKIMLMGCDHKISSYSASLTTHSDTFEFHHCFLQRPLTLSLKVAERLIDRSTCLLR